MSPCADGPTGPRLLSLLTVLLAAVFAGTACRTRPEPIADPSHAAWRAAREKSIGGPDGWTTLAGLHWLQEGPQSIGTGTHCRIQLPPGSAAELVGTLTRTGPRVRFEAAPGVDVRLRGTPVTTLDLRSDKDGTPDELAVGRIRFWLLERGLRRAIRVRDPESPERRAFHGIPTHAFDPRWRIPARFVAADPHFTTLADVTGGTAIETVAGTLEFEIGGKPFRLEALEDREEKDLWVLFGDSTSGHATYGSGRFLHVPLPGPDGRTTIDFNRAYNPPCAFTPYATCPIPPRGNWLPVAIPAGELAPPHPR